MGSNPTRSVSSLCLFFRPSRPPLRSIIFRRRLAGLLLLLCLPVGLRVAAFLLAQHTDRHTRFLVPPEILAPPARPERLLIFAPHPDDETLGCAGTLQQAQENGARVDVAMLTNGDGFQVAVARQFRKMRIEAADYVRFAALRQVEAQHVLGSLGVPADRITFFGYPDRGLLSLWREHWLPTHLYLSPYTRCDRAPYALAYEREAPYCGQHLLALLKALLREKRPTAVYVTHPADDHPDHSASSAFVTLALLELRREGEAWAERCEIRYYLIHRGDYPLPQGLQTGDPLPPPAEMAALDTRWRSLPLTPVQTARKAEAIDAYQTQTSVARRFLVSFARRNELFGSLPETVIPRRSTPQGDESSRLLPDPVDDSLLRDLFPGADIRAVFASHDGETLSLRLKTAAAPNRLVTVTVRFRFPPTPTHPQGFLERAFSLQRDAAELTLPLMEIGGVSHFALSLETRFAGLPVDQTGIRFFTLAP